VVFWVDGAVGVTTTIRDDATGMIYVAAMDQMMTQEEYDAWRTKIAKMDRKAQYMRERRAKKAGT